MSGNRKPDWLTMHPTVAEIDQAQAAAIDALRKAKSFLVAVEEGDQFVYHVAATGEQLFSIWANIGALLRKMASLAIEAELEAEGD